MNIKAALRTDRMCKALTGLTVREFQALTHEFEWNYREYQAKRKPNRKRKIGGGRDSKLEEVEQKLFYILWYMKNYPTFDMAGFLVGFHRSNACEWVHSLRPILETTLKRKLVLPVRKISDSEEFLRLYPEAREVFADGIERSIQRAKNKKKQQKNYSGKKKQHTRKSIIVTDEHKKVLVLTPQKSGRRHDKRLADKQDLFRSLPADVDAFVDTGFAGVNKVHPRTYMPAKKPRGRPLTDDEKEMNTLISSYRVVVEHAIAGVKRYRCIAEKLRNHKAFIDDQLLLLATGLWNYHLEMR